MRSFWLGVMFLSLGGTAVAQTGALTVEWDASLDPSVATYRVYFGLTSTALNGSVEYPADTQTCPGRCSIQLTGLQPVTTYFVQVASVTGPGCESARSALMSHVSSNPGPVCSSVGPLSISQGARNQPITIVGVGFETNPTIVFSHPPFDTIPITIRSAQQIGTTEIRLNVDVALLTPIGAASVTVRNQDPTQPAAVCANTIDIAQLPSRADVNGSGRVDGYDMTVLAIAFDTFYYVCRLDAPTRKGLACDRETDCGGANGATDFCTHDQCVIGAPANGLGACRAEENCGGTTGVTNLCVPSAYNPLVDLNADWIVDGQDLSLMNAQFGKHP